ncbi:MAG: CPBP family intramembrane metalloprotease [Hamadaea sp.]|nr:CPBP family intramembrane metalloprotease [Hamadaea sp.]
MQRVVFAGGLGVFAAALLGLLLTGHAEVRPSPDADTAISVWGALLPPLAAMALIRLVPPRAPAIRLPAVGGLGVLVAVAVAFPSLWYAVELAGVDDDLTGPLYVLTKPVAFLLLPWLILRATGDRPLLPVPEGERLWLARGAWRWWAAIPALAVFFTLFLFGPLAGPLPDAAGLPPAAELAVIATLTFLTANVTEELFYRVALQSRLEQAYGRWPAIVASALFFAFMHLPNHGQGTLATTLAAIVVFQGAFGLMTGYLWARYRNVWVLVAAHTLSNTAPLLFAT